MTRTPKIYTMKRIDYIRRIEEELNKNEPLPAPYYRLDIENASILYNELIFNGLFKFLELAEKLGLPKEIFQNELMKENKK